MTVSELALELDSSETYQRLDPKLFQLLRAAVALIDVSPEGLMTQEVAAGLADRFPRELLEERLPSLLNRFGLLQLQADRRWLTVPVDELRRPFQSMPVCVFDVEATGGRPPLHRIIELGYLRIESSGEERTHSSLVNPGRPLPPFITQMTGLKQAQLDSAPPMEEVMPDLERALDGAILVAHDVSGDLELLNYESFRLQGRMIPNPVVCTVALTKELRPEIEKAGLEAVANELGIEFSQRHRALDDAIATARLWQILFQDLKTQGVETLLELSFFQGGISEPPFLRSSISVERLGEIPSGPGVFTLRDADGQVLHVDSSADLRTALHGIFYARRRLPPALKRVMRQTADFHLEEHETAGKAASAAAALRSKLPRRPEPLRRRGWRRRRTPDKSA